MKTSISVLVGVLAFLNLSASTLAFEEDSSSSLSAEANGGSYSESNNSGLEFPNNLTRRPPGNPGHGNPGHGNPGHGNPGHGNPGHGNPGHGNPGHGRGNWNGMRHRWGSYPSHFWRGPFPIGETWDCVTVDSDGETFESSGLREQAADLSLDECYDNSEDPESCTLQVCT